MADILHDLPIKVTADRVFWGISTAEGLDTWWTERAAGEPREGETYELGFGPDYQWRAMVTRCVPDTEFELQMVRADAGWLGTRVGFTLEPRNGVTWLRFRHTGWPDAGEHYRISCNCWAMYLRILRRALEYGESVPYDARLDV